MSSDSLIVETAERLFAELCTDAALAAADAGECPDVLWDRIAEFGLPLAMVGADDGGAGVSDIEAFALIRAAGAFALPLPIAETMLANRLLAMSGQAPHEAPTTLLTSDGLTIGEDEGGVRISGSARKVPWGRSAQVVVVFDTGTGARIANVPRQGYVVEEGTNIANEPRDTLGFDCLVECAPLLATALPEPGVDRLLAAARTCQMAGAMERIARMSVDYALERQQFGRPIAKFQAVQQNLAVLCEHVAAAAVAADMAAEAAWDSAAGLSVAAAKASAGDSAGIVASLAHQVHGAMGFTHEYRLHHLTRRLWAWRDECGNDTYWARQIGRALAAGGPDGLWPAITAI